MPRYGYGGSERFAGPRQFFDFDPSKCGTRKGYRQHQNHGVEQCTGCKAAHARYMKGVLRGQEGCLMAGYVYKGKEPITPKAVEAPVKPKRKQGACGEPGGARRHRRLGEPVCDLCREAWNRYAAERRGGVYSGRRNRPVAVCGTPSGHGAHVRRGEPSCDPCKAALNEYRRGYRARKKAA